MINKTLKKLGVKENYFKITKTTYEKCIAKKTQWLKQICFSFKIRNKARILILIRQKNSQVPQKQLSKKKERKISNSVRKKQIYLIY